MSKNCFDPEKIESLEDAVLEALHDLESSHGLYVTDNPELASKLEEDYPGYVWRLDNSKVINDLEKNFEKEKDKLLSEEERAAKYLIGSLTYSLAEEIYEDLKLSEEEDPDESYAWADGITDQDYVRHSFDSAGMLSEYLKGESIFFDILIKAYKISDNVEDFVNRVLE